jgi:ribulose-bisphosphate carboxylase large chain
MHVNGLRNKFSEPDDSVITAARSVLQPVAGAEMVSTMPVFSSGQTGLQAADTYAAIGCADLIHTAGGGIFGHPQGVAAGWKRCARPGWPPSKACPAQHARNNKALQAALGFWK